ncbi:MAG: hypothetical protein ABII64_02730 [Elusimicrobiota bacterium]
MKKCLVLFTAIFASIIMAASPAFATVDHLMTDWDGSGWNVSTWAGGYEVGIATGETTTDAYLGPVAGNSLHIYWSYGAAAGRWGGGNANFDSTAVDVSTYSALSFWIYTPNANTGITVQMQDHSDFGDDMGRVQLQDYLVTGVNTWQNVIIPLDAFKRAQPALDFKIKEIKWMSEYDQGSDIAGSIYIDNISFVILAHAPTRSRVYSGTDIWTANTADAPGDTLMVWDLATSSVSSNLVNVQVSTGYAIAWTSTPADKYALPGTTAYFAYQIVNNGNSGDEVVFSSQVVVGSTWPFTIYWDKDKSGTMTSGDTAYDRSVSFIPESTYYFLIQMYVPVGTALESQTTVQLTAKDFFGGGGNDTWPTGADDDTITDSFSLNASGALMSLMKSTDTAVARPGDTTILVTLTYDNSGNEPATNLYITEALPFNTYLAADPSADPGLGNADSIEYYVGSAWQGGYDVTATKVRWKDDSVPSGSGDQTVSYKIKIK